MQASPDAVLEPRDSLTQIVVQSASLSRILSLTMILVALAVPRRVLALKTSKTSLKTWHSRRVFKTWSQILVTLQTDLQDVTRRLGAFTLEPRRHKTLPYAASPDYVKFQAVIKSAATVSFLLRLSAKGCVIRTGIVALC